MNGVYFLHEMCLVLEVKLEICMFPYCKVIMKAFLSLSLFPEVTVSLFKMTKKFR